MCANDFGCRFNVSPARLAKLVEEYERKRLPSWKKERAFFRNASRSTAMKHAGLAMWKDGKRLRHQNRISRRALAKAHRALKAVKSKLEGRKNFDALHTLIDRTVRSIKGIGELYVYDTALRLGAGLGRSPGLVYLHAGPRKAARSLGCIDYRAKSVPVRCFPVELQALPAAQIENFLCTMRRKFHG
jgi:hypothetical protein